MSFPGIHEEHKEIIVKQNGGTTHAQMVSERHFLGSDELDVRAIFSLLWKRKYWLILGMFLFATGAVIWNNSRPPMYEAMSIVQVGNGYSSSESKSVPLESLDSIKTWFLSDRVLMGLAQEIGHAGSFRSLRNAVKISGDLRTMNFPELFASVSLRLDDPDNAVKGIQFLTSQLIENHAPYYAIAINNLNESIEYGRRVIKVSQSQIANLKFEIDSTNAQIQADRNYYSSLSKQLPTSSEETKSTKQEKERIRYMELSREMNDVTIRFHEREKEISKTMKEVIQLESNNESTRLMLVQNEKLKTALKKTALMSPPQVSEDSGKVNTFLVSLYGAVAGFMVVFLTVFLIASMKKTL